MTNDEIEKFLTSKQQRNDRIRIQFKTRNAIIGIFIPSPDKDYLKSKNFWRIVAESNIENWKKSKDIGLARLFNGAEFTKLSVAQ